jgi:hypothetical protein
MVNDKEAIEQVKNKKEVEAKESKYKMNKSNIPFTRMIIQLPLDDCKDGKPPKDFFTIGWVICNNSRCEQFASSCSSCKLDIVKNGMAAYNQEKKRYDAKKSGLILP